MPSVTKFYQALAGGLPIERAVAAGRIAAYNEDKQGRDWGVPVLYLRAADGQLFEGAADPEARQRQRNSAEAYVDIRAGEVRAGAVLVGADIDKMLSGKLKVAMRIAGAVLGEAGGAVFGDIEGGSVDVQMDVVEVGPKGSVTGLRVRTFGGASSKPKKNRRATRIERCFARGRRRLCYGAWAASGGLSERIRVH